MSPLYEPDQLITPPHFIGHKIASGRRDPIDAILYEYLLAGNGLTIRASRDEFSVSLPFCVREVKGLPNSQVGIFWKKPRIRPYVWQEILRNAQYQNPSSEFKEDVYLVYWDKTESRWRWKRAGRERNWSATIADDTLPEYAGACIELHTHPPGALNFSKADDRDESGKFRIFAILIDVHDKPKIRFRCGVYDHFFEVPSCRIGALPDGVIDLNEIEVLVQMML